jgi:hypothetical protein
MFAVAQKKYSYIYDSDGMELHCLKKHIDVHCLDFLPFHYLLVSVVSCRCFMFYSNVLTCLGVCVF